MIHFKDRVIYIPAMGGFGSGRSGGRLLMEQGLRIDLGLLLRQRWIIDGEAGNSRLNWSRDGEPIGAIALHWDLRNPDYASLTLQYSRKRDGKDWQERRQRIRLSYTLPPFGGRRWWMHCPANGDRVAKLYLPAGGDIFAGRKAWRLAYQSQRIASRDRPFEATRRLQRKLGGLVGWETGLVHPKGMWHETFARHAERFERLDDLCTMEIARIMHLLGPV